MSTRKQNQKGTLALIKTDDVPQALNLLQSRLDSMKEIETTQWKTTGKLEGFGDIREEKKISNLIKAWSSVKNRDLTYTDAAGDLPVGDTYEVFTISGGTKEDWFHDICLKIKIINFKEEFDKLKEYKARAEKFLSEEDQKSILFEEIKAFLNK